MTGRAAVLVDARDLAVAPDLLKASPAAGDKDLPEEAGQTESWDWGCAPVPRQPGD